MVTLLLALAAAYNIAIAINRESEDEAIKKASRRVILKAHPDKGGTASDFRRLNDARGEGIESSTPPTMHKVHGAC